MPTSRPGVNSETIDAFGNVPVWDDKSWQPLPALDGDATCDTCVVGLGGTGLTAIAELLDRGIDVIGIDAADVGAGAAGRNGGFLLAGAYDFYHDAVRLHGRERARNIYAATLEEMHRIADEAPGTVRFVGSRRIAANDAEVEDCRVQYNVMREDMWSVEWRDDSDGIGLFLPSDASFNPLARCRILAHKAVSRGARLYGLTPVRDLAGDRVTHVSGAIHCKRVIVAVDGRLELLLPELQPRVRTARLQMLATQPTTERMVPCPMYFREGFEYWQQLPDNSLALGGFRDKAGDSEWSVDAVPTSLVQGMLDQFLREQLQVTAPVSHRWAACAAYTSTGLPVLEEVRPNVWATGAYCGTGNVIGALCGRAVVEASLDGDWRRVRLLFG